MPTISQASLTSAPERIVHPAPFITSVLRSKSAGIDLGTRRRSTMTPICLSLGRVRCIAHGLAKAVERTGAARPRIPSAPPTGLGFAPVQTAPSVAAVGGAVADDEPVRPDGVRDARCGGSRAGRDLPEILDRAVRPSRCVDRPVLRVGLADDHAGGVDSTGKAERASGQDAEVAHRAVLPRECPVAVARLRNADDRPSRIDREPDADLVRPAASRAPHGPLRQTTAERAPPAMPETPTISPRSLMSWADEKSAPGRTPRSAILPLRQTNPCVEPSARLESPTTSPCALIARAWLVSPPSVPSETSVYRGGSGATVGLLRSPLAAAHPVGGGADSVSATPITSDHVALLAQRTGRPQGRPPVRCRGLPCIRCPASGAGGSPAGGWFCRCPDVRPCTAHREAAVRAAPGALRTMCHCIAFLGGTHRRLCAGELCLAVSRRARDRPESDDQLCRRPR